jgi:Tetratricopeptide repeat
MPQELIEVTTNRWIIRVLMILFLVLSVIWAWFVVSWYVGNMLAENVTGPGDREIELAHTAVSLSPSDPLTHWRLANLTQLKSPSKIEEAIPEYQKAVSLSPNDYRFWMTLGIALEQAGHSEQGEAALKRAVSLAPAYAQGHWYLGNLLLRNGDYEEAFKELNIASEANSELRPQFYTMLREIYGADFDSLLKAIGGKPAARADFALYLVKRGRFEDGMRLWSTLSPANRTENRGAADAIIASLLASKKYYEALNVWNDVAPTPLSRASIGRILDGGFEDLSGYGPEMVFAWQVKTPAQMQINVDRSNAHSGRRSLRLVFQVRDNLTSLGTTQLIPVAPNTEYEFEFYRKSQNLESGSTPFVELTDAATGKSLTASDGAPNGNSDWQRVGLTFKTPPDCWAVIVALKRGLCPDADLCPIFGTVWYDDFNLKPRN